MKKEKSKKKQSSRDPREDSTPIKTKAGPLDNMPTGSHSGKKTKTTGKTQEGFPLAKIEEEISGNPKKRKNADKSKEPKAITTPKKKKKPALNSDNADKREASADDQGSPRKIQKDQISQGVSKPDKGSTNEVRPNPTWEPGTLTRTQSRLTNENSCYSSISHLDSSVWCLQIANILLQQSSTEESSSGKSDEEGRRIDHKLFLVVLHWVLATLKS